LVEEAFISAVFRRYLFGKTKRFFAAL